MRWRRSSTSTPREGFRYVAFRRSAPPERHVPNGGRMTYVVFHRDGG
jgi:hypothetical protein